MHYVDGGACQLYLMYGMRSDEYVRFLMSKDLVVSARSPPLTIALFEVLIDGWHALFAQGRDLEDEAESGDMNGGGTSIRVIEDGNVFRLFVFSEIMTMNSLFLCICGTLFDRVSVFINKVHGMHKADSIELDEVHRAH